MHHYDDEYYFITFKETGSRPVLGPDEDTDSLRFERENVTSGLQRPLFFTNVAAQAYRNMKFKSPPPDILFCGADALVDDKIYNKLIELNIPNLILQPSVYMDEKETWHENYWFLTFTQLFDCWSRKDSSYDPDPIDLNGKDFFSIYSFKLDAKLLETVDLKDRLLFKMGADLDEHIVLHKSLVPIFRTSNVDGMALVPVKDYGVTFFH